MFIVLLKFSANRSQSGAFLDGHKAWLQRGFDEGVFLLAGQLKPDVGGGILAHKTSLAELQGRVSEDPYVRENVVTAEIYEMTPARADTALKFLLA